MDLAKVQVGARYTYYPPKTTVDDNSHFPAVVDDVKKTVKVRIFMAGAPDGVVRRVSAKRLADQGELV